MSLLAAVQNHGYAATALILLLSSCGLPLPISVVLLTAGAAAHSGSLNLGVVILCAASAALLGDTVMYLGGRFTGWWLLAGLCRISLNPETCIFGSARSFYRRGPRTLLFAKFIPGLGTVAAPLAGSLNMRLLRFLRLDAFGVFFYAVVCIGGALLVKQNPPMWAVATIAVVTALPIIGVFLLMRRLLAETDEYTRKLHTDALLNGGGITFSLTVVWSFFELYGVVPQDRYFPATLFIVPIFLGLYGLTLAVTRVKNEESACES